MIFLFVCLFILGQSLLYYIRWIYRARTIKDHCFRVFLALI